MSGARRWLAATVSGGLLAAALTAAGGSAVGASDPAVDKAQALAAAPGLDRRAPALYGPAEARAAAERRLEQVPLPPGGTLERIRWEELGGRFSARDVEVFAEYNAFCQWLAAAHAGRDRATALAVLDQVPSWPVFRQIADFDYHVVVAEAHAGAGPALERKLAECAV